MNTHLMVRDTMEGMVMAMEKGIQAGMVMVEDIKMGMVRVLKVRVIMEALVMKEDIMVMVKGIQAGMVKVHKGQAIMEAPVMKEDIMGSMVMVGMVVEEDMDMNMNNMVMVVDITHIKETIFQFLPS